MREDHANKDGGVRVWCQRIGCPYGRIRKSRVFASDHPTQDATRSAAAWTVGRLWAECDQCQRRRVRDHERTSEAMRNGIRVR